MNRLPFGSFHAAHFSPQQVQQWQSYLQNIQSPLAFQNYAQEEVQQYTNEFNKDTTLPTDQDAEGDQGDEDDDNLFLSKEAIAIFEFSEAYSAQRKYLDMTKYYVHTIFNLMKLIFSFLRETK
ncbi:hypothetical protein BCR42DRAFT_412555 [Absidia repens]|uniref:Uncharacterized protein n=1 Tax=Absidia repens TaxID=90262 RepID=A0A1X2IJS4_9FUNG|nr:hypothetical protein BCR42DRAFT_412555 [Absidia repens]